eukprot:SAG31_NODE_1642_length_7657_cov_3.459402_6_plen_68_part_00
MAGSPAIGERLVTQLAELPKYASVKQVSTAEPEKYPPATRSACSNSVGDGAGQALSVYHLPDSPPTT